MRTERPGAFQLHAAPFGQGFGDDDDPPSSDSGSSPVVAVVSVRGLLSSEVSGWDCGFSDGYQGQGGIVDQVARALGDPNVVAVVLDVMSPGGDAMGCGEAAAQIAAMRLQSGKPMSVYARQACSAAYWLATAAADEGAFFVSESSEVANVGCWMAHADFSEANKQDGVEVTYVADPPGKVLGNPDEPLDKAALARMQRSVQETTARFCASVASFRPAVGVADLMSLDGDTRRGAEAVKAGLADGVASSLEDVVASAYQRAVAAKPPVLTSPGGMPAKGNQMNFSKELVSLVGLPSGASDAAVEAAILPRLSFAAAALEGLGEADPVKARGKLAAKLEEAASAEGLRKELAAKTAETDAARREKLVEEAVAAGKLRSGQAYRWTEGPNGERVRHVASFLAGMATASLEGYLEGLPAIHREAVREKDPDTSAAEAAEAVRGASFSPQVLQLAARSKINPDRLAQATAALFGGVAAVEE